MRVVVGVVAVVALVVAVAEGDSLMTRSKKYKLCTARDINMFVTQLCSGALTRMRVGRHNSHPAPGILTIRIPPRGVRGPVVSPAEIEVPSEYYGNGLTSRSKKWLNDQRNEGEGSSAMIWLRRKRLTFGDIRQKCCTDGCYASELQSLCA
ncbi:uncharacterized protein LOC123515613 isoform X3 [Portunus trituberculatus]|uniref:uncharacterized protein LOC123515613 isoform X3 n=1 Tax=Portunus trituberculatus TaxID=210409 RepID=UPI001E1CC390|nr:uncharacterized protein LOC123515613 isoform X3 [Portunus trituberculatus]